MYFQYPKIKSTKVIPNYTFCNLNNSNNQAPEYDNDYMSEADDDYILDGPPPPLEDLKQVEQRADVTRADVPKHAGILFNLA